MGEDLKFFRRVFAFNMVRSTDYLNKYRSYKTDEERSSFALEIAIQYSHNLLDSDCEQKSSVRSIKSRENGNKSFKDGQHYKALEKYTESIVHALQSSEELALAYANRSAVLFKLEKYAQCIDDIDRALNLKYPDKLKAKLYRRKGLCLSILGRPGAESSYQEALAWLKEMELSTDEMNKSKSELEQLNSTHDEAVEQFVDELVHPPPKINTPNPEIPCASKAVALKYTNKFGRHLVATRHIKPGEILITEKPYCTRLMPKNLYTHCSDCLQVSWNLIPCKFCINVAYCSDTCKDVAWNEYHEVDCPVLGFLRRFQLDDVLEIGTRMAIMATKKGKQFDALREELLTIGCNRDQRTKGFSVDGKLHSDQYRSLYYLTHNIDKKSVRESLVRAYWVALTVCILARESNMFGKTLPIVEILAKNPDVLFIGGLIFKHVNIACMNVTSFGAPRSRTSYEHGNVLMALGSLINHSCDPNVFAQCYAGCRIIFATYPIERGEQIFETYGPRWNEMKKRDRKELFNKCWNFDCECIPCKKNWPLLAALPSYEDQNLTRENKDKVDKALQRYETSLKCFIKDCSMKNLLKMLEKESKSIEMLYKVVHKPCKELYEFVESLRNYYSSADALYNYVPASSSPRNTRWSMYYLSLRYKLSQT